MYSVVFCSDTKPVKQQLRYLILILAFALTTICASNAFGAGAQFGILGGASVPDAANTGQYLLYGIKGSTFAMENITVGGYYLLSNDGTQVSDQELNYSLIGVQAMYQVPAGSGETYMGVRAGITKLHFTPSAGATAIVMSPYHYGITVGHDYFIKDWVMFGFEGSYLHVETGKASTTIYDSFNLINFLVSIQFRL